MAQASETMRVRSSEILRQTPCFFGFMGREQVFVLELKSGGFAISLESFFFGTQEEFFPVEDVIPSEDANTITEAVDFYLQNV